MPDDDYLSTSAAQLQKAWREANEGLAETIHDAPSRYDRGGIGEVVFGSPAWQAYQAAAQAGLPKTPRVGRDEGGSIPYFAQDPDQLIADAMRIAAPKYDTGPQPGEAVTKPYEPSIGEKVSSYLMGDQRPTPKRRHVAERVGALTEYKDFDEWSAAPESSLFPVHSIPITPRLREEILRGLHAYAMGGKVIDQIEGALRLAKSHRAGAHK